MSESSSMRHRRTVRGTPETSGKNWLIRDDSLLRGVEDVVSLKKVRRCSMWVLNSRPEE